AAVVPPAGEPRPQRGERERRQRQVSREYQQRVGDHLAPRVARRFRRRVEPVRGLPTDRVGEYVPPDLPGDRGRPRRAGPGRDADREQVPPPEQEAELTAPAEQ